MDELKSNSLDTSTPQFPTKTKLPKKMFLPEQTSHGVAADVVQRRIVLVLLSIWCVWVQAFPELRVPFIQLPGQGLVASHQRLTKLGGRVAHGSELLKGHLPGDVADACLLSFLPAHLCLLPPPPPSPPPPFTAGHTLEQHGSVFSCPVRRRESEMGTSIRGNDGGKIHMRRGKGWERVEGKRWRQEKGKKNSKAEAGKWRSKETYGKGETRGSSSINQSIHRSADVLQRRCYLTGNKKENRGTEERN